MKTNDISQEALDRLVLLLASEPRPGWEDLYENLSRREVERLAPPAEQNRESKQHLEGCDG